MYSYTYDSATGGIVLNSTPTVFSKEPRPVYSKEMDILGFDRYWSYEVQNEIPYMWAESNVYWYRGTQIAKIKGGDLYTKPELQPLHDENGEVLFSAASGYTLEPINIDEMCAINHELLSVIEDSTVKKIVKEYEKFREKLDIFHVAFSGGKDSAVLLDLVKKALPRDSFVVIFGDTGMEFPDTYEAVKYTEEQCLQDNTPFYIARSHFTPQESWDLFGPPSRTLRWCCSVHKSTPQTLKMREITGKNDYAGLDYVGVRKHESLARSTYEYENYGKKQKGQRSFNPLLEWTSAEIWLYIFSNKIYINKAYKKGNSRAGCLLCPMAGGSSGYIRRCNYPDEIDGFIDIIKRKNNWDNYSEAELHSYVTSGGWDNRRSGRGIAGNTVKYKEKTENGIIRIEIEDPHENWKEWLKTTDIITVPLTIKKTETGAVFEMAEQEVKAHPTIGKITRQALKKAAYCVGCRVCETNCKFGHIRFIDGKITINDCIQCHECHDIPGGCHAYNALKMPQGEKKMKTINCFDDHAPKRDWLVAFFEQQDDFFEDNTLGPNMFTHFKRFLRDAKLIDGNKCTSFSKLISEIGWESDTALALMLVNLAYENAQFEWYISQMDTGYFYESSVIKERLLSEDMKEKAANSIIKSYKRICGTPFGSVLNFGFVTDDDDMVRSKCTISDNRVILYALYKFCEKCNMDREFSVSYSGEYLGNFVKDATVQILTVDFDEAGHVWYQVRFLYGDDFKDGTMKWTDYATCWILSDETGESAEEGCTVTDFAYTLEYLQQTRNSGRRMLKASPMNGFTLKNINGAVGGFYAWQSGLYGSSGKDSDYPQLAKSAAHGTIYATPHYLEGFTVFCLEHNLSGPGEGSGKNQSAKGPYVLVDMDTFVTNSAYGGTTGVRYKASTMHALGWVLRHTYPFMALNRSDSNNEVWSRAAGQFAMREVIKQLEGAQYVRS